MADAKFPWMTFELPLFRRELTEQAQRKRTYVLRCLCTVVFALVFMTAFMMFLSEDVPVVRLLGSGRRIFVALMITMMVAVLALTPALACSAISLEKEKQTLGLLMVSRLSPWTIIFEKLLSRMTPMVTLLLAATPLFALTYVLGGVEVRQLILGGWVLFATVAQITAIALLCSAVLDSALAAFWGTYVLMGKLYFAWPILVELNILNQPGTPRWFSGLNGILNFLGYPPDPFQPTIEEAEFLFFPGFQMAGLVERATLPEEYALLTVPGLMVTVAALIAARFGLTRFSHDSLLNLKLPLRDRWRRLTNRLRRRSSVDITVKATRRIDRSQQLELMNHAPLAWRERQASIVARPRMVIFLCAMLFFLPAGILDSDRPPGTDDFCVLLSVFTQVVCLLLIVGLGSKVFARERERQTLDTLMAAPLSNRELLDGKLQVINRLILMLLAPIALVGIRNVFYSPVRQLTYGPTAQRGGYSNYYRNILEFGTGDWLLSSVFYVACLLAHAYVFMHLVKWISVLIGLRQQSLMRTLVASLATILAICFVPFLLFIALSLLSGTEPDDYFLFFLSTPMIVVAFNEYHDFMPLIRHLGQMPFSELVLAGCSLALYGGLTFGLRSVAHANLAQLMVRADADAQKHIFRPEKDRLAARHRPFAS